MKLNVTVIRTAEISTDGNYCASTEKEYCRHLHGVFAMPVPRCELFKKKLQRCLGGGPLRCQECLEAERGVTVVKPENMPPIAWTELLDLLDSLDIQWVKNRIMCTENAIEKAGAMIWLRKFDTPREITEQKAKEDGHGPDCR